MRRSRLVLLLVLGMLTALLPLGTAPAGATTGDLVITGVVDGPLPGGIPKAVEVFVANNIPDLSIYGIGSANNGGGTDGEEFTFPAVSAVSGQFIYVASEAAGFNAFFGFAPDYTSGAASINGDDAIELFKNGGVVDVFGDINVDGSGQPWDHVDGWAYRIDGSGQNGTTFALANWTFSGPNALDGETDNATATTPFPIGSYTATVVDVPPTVNAVVPADGANGVALDSDVVVTFSEDVTVTDPWFGISCVTSGAHSAVVGGGPSVFTLNPDTDYVNEEVCTVSLTAAQIADLDGTVDNLAADFESSFTTAATGPTRIHAIQGAGFISPMVGDTVTIEGVVVGDFQEAGQIGGFHVQEEDTDADGDHATSEGIYVFAPNAIDVSIGDTVRVTGDVSEFFGLTELTNFSGDAASIIDSVGSATPATVTLPFASTGDLEAFEGMSVLLPQALVISEYFNFDRFGEIVLTTDRAAQPTAVFEPGSVDAANLADLNSRSRITLDDGRGSQNPDPALHPNGAIFDLTNRFRGGDTVTNLPGVMDYSFGAYKIQPTTGGDYASVNPRSATPDAVGGDIQVATFNVLNYFTTLDDSGSICGPLGDLGCRGADNADEFTRQRDKIISAITAIDADVVGLMEIENDAADVAVADLVSGLNAATAAGTYDYIATGPVGADAIRVALIYQPAMVTPYGSHAVLEGEFLDPNNTGSERNRAALAQSFLDNANGGVFTVAVNHLKSKGSPCGTGDDDSEQGSCNLTRTLAAQILASWLQTDPTGSGDADFLIIGDLNSYDMEDPIDVLKALGYTDLAFRDIGPFAYSYLFSAELGYLDYVMANQAAAAQVTDTTIWHINADEPDILDYDTSFKRDAQDALYEPNAFRSSDHDPVIVGLELTVTPMQAKAHSLTVLSSLLPTGNRNDDKRIDKAIESIEDSLNPAYWVDDFHLTDKGEKVFDEEKKAVKELTKVGGTAKADAQVVIAALVEADRTLAATVIAEAAAAGADTTKAEKALAEGDAESKPDKAIDDYKKAWKEATKALGKVEVRFATFNASLNRFNAGDLVSELMTPGSPQPAVIAEIIQRSNPDVLLINEFDYDAGGLAAQLFQDNYLSVSQGGADPVEYPYWYVAPSNTGVYSGFDLDNSGVAGDFVPNDSFGFGFFEGQFGMAVASKYPINWSDVRTFQNFLWKDMPGALLPDDPAFAGPADWYSPEELDVFRLSSKSHWDVPIVIGDETVHFLTSHPTPPVFDGPEDRNGTRNFDEIRFWADYVDGGGSASYIYDDAGSYGGLANDALFVIAGDQNSDPLDGDSIPGAIQQLLESSKVNTKVTPSSLGGTEQSALQGGINVSHLSDPAFDTADFSDFAPGNLRADYVLPRKNMKIIDAAVFWPETSDPLFPLVGTFPFPSSDHRLVWIDVEL